MADSAVNSICPRPNPSKIQTLTLRDGVRSGIYPWAQSPCEIVQRDISLFGALRAFLVAINCGGGFGRQSPEMSCRNLHRAYPSLAYVGGAQAAAAVGKKNFKKGLAQVHANCTVSPPFDLTFSRLAREEALSKKPKSSLPI